MSSYYLSIRPLCVCCFPVKIVRERGVTLQIVDPRSTRAELLTVAYDLLEPWEHDAGLRAYGQPPVGFPMASSMVEGQCLPYVPPSIRVPGEPAIQNPDLTTEAGRVAFREACDWVRLEVALARAYSQVA